MIQKAQFVSDFIRSKFFPGLEHDQGIHGNRQQYLNGHQEPRDDRKRSATTCFAIRFKSGVVIAADRRTVGGWYSLYSDQAIKLNMTSPFSAIASSGDAALCDFFARYLKNANDVFFDRYNRWLSPDGQVNYMRQLLQELCFFPECYAVPILAFYDHELKRGRIFSMEIATPFNPYCDEKTDFYGTGCGYESIQSIIRDNYYDGLNLDETISLSIRAMYHSGKSSIGVTDLRIALPHVAIIDPDNFRLVSAGTLRRHANIILKKYEKIIIQEI